MWTLARNFLIDNVILFDVAFLESRVPVPLEFMYLRNFPYLTLKQPSVDVEIAEVLDPAPKFPIRILNGRSSQAANVGLAESG